MAFRFFKFREQENPDMVKPFLDHLEDLRWMLVKMALTLAITSGLSFAFRAPLMQFAERPLHAVQGEQMISLMALGVADSMTISFSLAFYAGIVLAFPVLLYQLAGFVLPALTAQERRYIWPAVGVSFGLFMIGVSACFAWVLPPTLRFFAADAARLGLRPNWTIDQYFSFVANFVLAFGLSFEMPVVVLILVRIGLLNYTTLKRTRSYAVVGILLLAAVIAPPELLTMLAMAAPMLVLYEACIWLAWWLERSQLKKAAILERERLRLEEALRAEREIRERQEQSR